MKIKRISGVLVAIETNLDYVCISSKAKRIIFKDVSVINAIMLNKNLDKADILKRLFDLGHLLISCIDNLYPKNNVL